MDKLSDVGSERAVLAGLIQHGIDGYITIADLISHETFVNTNNQIIYKCITNCIENDIKVDVSTIISAAQQLEVLDYINTEKELKYIKSLTEFPIQRENILSFAAQIKEI